MSTCKPKIRLSMRCQTFLFLSIIIIIVVVVVSSGGVSSRINANVLCFFHDCVACVCVCVACVWVNVCVSGIVKQFHLPRRCSASCVINLY